MPTDVFPVIQIPVISVVWIYDNLMPQDVEGRITYVFERFLTQTVEGIKYIMEQFVIRQLHHQYLSSARNRLRRSRGRSRGDCADVVKALPPDISPPMIMRLESSSVPVAMLQITSDHADAGRALQPRHHANPAPARDDTGRDPAASLRREAHAA